MKKFNLDPEKWRGFTLIELLIVIAIILILISIALPNFLEAQVRAKVANAQGELRSLMVTTEMYRNDFNGNEPRANSPGAYPTKVTVSTPYSSWWGFTSYLLTTPNKYINTIPFEPFSDTFTLGFWNQMKGTEGDPPYTVIRDTMTSMWPVGGNLSNNATVQAAAGGVVPIPQQFYDSNKKAGYIYYSSGPDRVDGTVWGSPQFYSPTNGTSSFGDMYVFGPGSPDIVEHRGLK